MLLSSMFLLCCSSLNLSKISASSAPLEWARVPDSRQTGAGVQGQGGSSQNGPSGTVQDKPPCQTGAPGPTLSSPDQAESSALETALDGGESLEAGRVERDEGPRLGEGHSPRRRRWGFVRILFKERGARNIVGFFFFSCPRRAGRPGL